MKIKLSDVANTEVLVSSVSQNYYGNAVNDDGDEASINIVINNPDKKFDYYKELFVNDSVASIDIINSNGVIIATLNGSKVKNISYNYQDENPSFVNIQIV